MAYRTPEKQRQAQARYRQTPAWRAASRRSHQNYIEKRRALTLAHQPLEIDAAPLSQAIQGWMQ